MGAADEKEKMTKKEAKDAPSLKHEEERAAKKEEEAPRARSKPEAPDGDGGTPVDSDSDYEDYSEDGDSEEASVVSSHEAAMGVADKKEKGTGKEVKRSGEEEEGKEEAPGAGYGLDNLDLDSGGLIVDSGSHHKDDSEESLSEVIKSMEELEELGSGERDSQQEHELHLPSQQLFNGRQESKCRDSQLGLSSDGPMVDVTLGLLEDCGLRVKRDSPEQYIATIEQLSNLRVFFQDSEEIVKNLSSGHLDIGIVGLHTVSEYEQGKEDLIIVHNALGCGHCRLSLAIPKIEIFERIDSVRELAQMPQWTEENPLRVVTGLPNLGRKFMEENGLKHVSISTARAPLEAAPAMGAADVILHLVSSKQKLEDNNLKEIEGGTALESQAVLVASRKSLIQWEGVRNATHEILERLEARLTAVSQIKVTAYVMGTSKEEVTGLVLKLPSLSVQGFTVNPVNYIIDGKVVGRCYEIVSYVPKEVCHDCMRQLKQIADWPVVASPLSYIFGEESKWQQLWSIIGPQLSV